MKKKSSLRGKFYRGWLKSCVQPSLVSWIAGKDRIEAGQRDWAEWQAREGSVIANPSPATPRYWFHAASVGELETLWPVIEELSRAGSCELILTVLSPSARGRLDRLRQELGEGARILYQGYSPWEGSWAERVRRLEPQVFITAKYEAWPELWMTLGELDVPLVILGARARRSLKTCKKVCSALGAKLPRMVLLASLPEDQTALTELFPDARVEMGGEPRWDRVFARAAKGNPRAAELQTRAQVGLARPWGVLGSVWPEDLEKWREAFTLARKGTLWVVPHKVDAEHLIEIEATLKQAGFQPIRSSRWTGARDRSLTKPAGCLLVDEMGFLSELYSQADWAYVGGGFGAGVHSTIEPAIHGIPISAGPRNAEKFSEITELRRSGQLSRVVSSEEISRWLSEVPTRMTDESKRTWRMEAIARCGASRRVAELLSALASR